MSFKPASDWVDAFPEEPNVLSRNLPPARARTRTAPAASSCGAASPPAFAPTPNAGGQTPTEIKPLPATASPTASYAVGYGKPPRHSQFQPGLSGNPRGRPKGAKSLNTLVRETLGGKVTVRTETGIKKLTRIEVVLQKTVEQAMKGSPKAQADLIKLWRSAVPDEKLIETVLDEEDITAADLAMLAANRNRQHQAGQNQP